MNDELNERLHRTLAAGEVPDPAEHTYTHTWPDGTTEQRVNPAALPPFHHPIQGQAEHDKMVAARAAADAEHAEAMANRVPIHVEVLEVCCPCPDEGACRCGLRERNGEGWMTPIYEHGIRGERSMYESKGAALAHGHKLAKKHGVEVVEL